MIPEARTRTSSTHTILSSQAYLLQKERISWDLHQNQSSFSLVQSYRYYNSGNIEEAIKKKEERSMIHPNYFQNLFTYIIKQQKKKQSVSVDSSVGLSGVCIIEPPVDISPNICADVHQLK